MFHNMTRVVISGLVGAVLGGGLLPAQACNVPVFRYALERWHPDPYEIVIFHRGPLAMTDQALVQDLRKLANNEPALSNIEVFVVNLDEEPEKYFQQLYEQQGRPPLPWLVARYPVMSEKEALIWSAPLREQDARQLLDSPLRRRIAQRLMAGETAVLVLLESGNKTKDDAAARLIAQELNELPKVLKLPELTDDPADQLLMADKKPLRIAFSLVRLARDDPAERHFTRMLRYSEPDLEFDLDVTPESIASPVGLLASPLAPAGLLAATSWMGERARGEPLVFTIFGRGRSLPAMIGAGINADNLLEDGRFLVGPCSCEVKRLNPGFDLLMTADWEEQLTERFVQDKGPPPLVGLSAFLPPSVEGQPASSPERAEEAVLAAQLASRSLAELANWLGASAGQALRVGEQWREDRGTVSQNNDPPVSSDMPPDTSGGLRLTAEVVPPPALLTTDEPDDKGWNALLFRNIVLALAMALVIIAVCTFVFRGRMKP